MIRRNFLRMITAAGVGTVGVFGIAEAGEKRTVSWHVKGFFCATCAVGMDTMLMRLHGVVRAHSTYPEGEVAIEFHPHLVTEESLKQCICDAGFSVA